MPKRSGADVKRQLFKGLGSRRSNLDSATSNLLSRTLRKNSDKYLNKSNNEPGEREFVIHKSTKPEDYEIFSTSHPIRESKLQALEQSEQAFNEVFHAGFDDSGSEDEEPDVSAIASPSVMNEDDILISVPGYSKEELTASKRLNINDRRNVRLSKVSPLERVFSSTDFLKESPPDKVREYDLINQEFNEHLEALKEHRDSLKLLSEGFRANEPADLQHFRELISRFDEDSWMYLHNPNTTTNTTN
ncbi:hypothetical protein WICANDRAFT_88531 [Wickerhamomyces anomalus NRRL Y-366-8]|uniref:Uncharacterized protein n=1 Tax=Wickerhamomyces anomalus (strain ATCC 58044 / CBS 1984 / NCYC 433 / NRRL Y-366-8) TaxID=683960 RepID=A0A1E3PC06_WICAA|nr:uncharacterized protein WICANDRAFT_88531 [Wickerhamomyces anomalus NRRL Y-366-8]ODQ62754.1 hypothetical protein WICANDRAFT_88531 [Wickerhamomyces anomalus NRRL Y-366-8]